MTEAIRRARRVLLNSKAKVFVERVARDKMSPADKDKGPLT